MERIRSLKNNGFVHLFLSLAMVVAAIMIMAKGIVPVRIIGFFLLLTGLIWPLGLFTVQPNQTRVLLFFGKYKGTVTDNGFFWLNPFISKKKVSLRARNLESQVIKVNDELGNPILISGVVVWKVVNSYKAIFDIEAMSTVNPSTGTPTKNREQSYKEFVKIQAESALRKIAHTYPYDDLTDGENAITLRSSFDEINHALEVELKERLALGGIEVLEARLSNLSYAPEIAAVMLQRQQAQAIIAARRKIVEGSVGMVEMAIEQLEEKGLVSLNNDQKAGIVSNLMVVLCSDNATNPVINTGMQES
ncbi:MAG: SPFH domain-containing protein [Bacteroidota bacterium]